MQRSAWIIGPALAAALFLSAVNQPGVFDATTAEAAGSRRAVTAVQQTAIEAGQRSQAGQRTNGAPSLSPNQTSATYRLRLRFEDKLTGQATPVRVGVFSATGEPCVPSPPEDYLFQTLGSRSFFYCDGYAEVDVPEGIVWVKASKGPEYDPVTFGVFAYDDGFYTLSMRHRIDMASRGWFAGDTHTHMTHSPLNYTLTPEDMALVMEAEDLNFMNSMDHEIHFTGAPHPLSTPERVLYFSREYGNPSFGHLSLLGLTEWISSIGGCPDTSLVACGRVLNSAIAEEVHAQPGAMLIITHPFPTVDYEDVFSWPGGGVARGIPIDLVDDGFDAMDLICYTTQLPPDGLVEYTQVLNAGFHVPSSAGTDAVLTTAASNPPGGYRVYAKAGNGPEDFNSQAWIDALRAGKTFVTNGPLFETFTIDGREIGESIATHATVLAGSVSVVCRVPMETVEVIAEGRVVAVFEPPVGSPGREISGSFTIPADSVRWVVARVTGADPGWHVIGAPDLFAQTGPIYVEYLDHPSGFVYPKQREAAYYFLGRLDQMTRLFDRYGCFPGDSRAVFDDAVARARDYYHGLVPDPPSDFALLEPRDWSNHHQCYVSATETPTFLWNESHDDDPGATILYEITYSPDSLFVTDVVTETVSDTFYTIPSAHPLTNLVRYFWKVTAVDETDHRVDSTPEMMSFLVDITGTGVRDRAPVFAWGLGPGRPNPFSGRLAIDYQVADGGGEHVLDVVDVRGAVVKRLYSGARRPGRYGLAWDGTNANGTKVASGVYFLRLVTARQGMISTRKIVLVR